MYENVVISAVVKQIQLMDDFRAAMLSIDMIRPHIPTEADGVQYKKVTQSNLPMTNPR